MPDVQELIELLGRVIEDRARRITHVKRFQEIVWSSENLHADPEIVRILRDLAYDLDFFEPNDQVRAEDPSLYGDARLEEEIRSVLEKLRQAELKPFTES